jgi:hypothetical protein
MPALPERSALKKPQVFGTNFYFREGRKLLELCVRLEMTFAMGRSLLLFI